MSAESDDIAAVYPIPAEFGHELAVSWENTVSQNIRMVAGEIDRTLPSDGEFLEGSLSIRCACGETFRSENKGEEHLKEEFRAFKRQSLPSPLPENIQPLNLQNGEEVGPDYWSAVPGVGNACGEVTSGLEYLKATARNTFHPPADFNFDEWEPLSDEGQLTFPTGHPRISKRLVNKALLTLAPTPDYDPGEFRLYDRGDDPFVLTYSGGGAVVIATRTVPSKAFEQTD